MSRIKKGDRVVCISDSRTCSGNSSMKVGDEFIADSDEFRYCGLPSVCLTVNGIPSTWVVGIDVEKIEPDSEYTSSEASRTLVRTLVLGDEIGVKEPKYLPEERELIINENF